MKQANKVIFSIFLLVIVFIYTNVTHAIEKATPTLSKAILIADVNIRNAKIISQNNNVFKITFDLSNGQGLQTGVKYGITLVSSDVNKAQTKVDEIIYDESLTLYENKTINKEITYTAPSSLNGVYTLFLISKNENDFPFSTAYLGEARLNTTWKGVGIVTPSCFLGVIGEKGNLVYKLDKVIDISKEETLSLTCVAKNISNSEIKVNPQVVIKSQSAYGSMIKTDNSNLENIIFKPNEGKTFVIKLPQILKSGIYYATISLSSDDNNVPNKAFFAYFVRGSLVKIDNLFIDKDYYTKGSTANLSLMWSSVNGKLLRSENPKNSQVVMQANISNYEGKKCSDPLSQPLIQDYTKPKTEFAVPIVRDCFNPKVIITLTDSDGNTLDEKGFGMQTVSVKKPISSTYLYAILGLIIILGIIIYMKKKKKNKNTVDNSQNQNTNTSIGIIVLFFAFLTLSFIPFYKANASTYYITSGTCSMMGDVSLNKTSYMTNETVTASASMSGSCASYDVWTGGVSATPYGGATPSSAQNIVASSGSGPGYYNFTANSYGGSGTMAFAEVLSSSAGTATQYSYLGFSVSVPVTPTVTVWASPSNTINLGSSVTINWSSANATSCISTDGGTYDTRLAGSYVVSPTTDKSYLVTCSGNGLNNTTGTTVYVVQPPAVKITSSASNVPYDGGVNIKWDVTNAVHGCTCSFSPANGVGSTYCGSSAPNAISSGLIPISKLRNNTTFTVTCDY